LKINASKKIKGLKIRTVMCYQVTNSVPYSLM